MKRGRLKSIIAAVALLVGKAASGQDEVPTPPGTADINALSHRMADMVRFLGEDIASDLGQTPQGQHLVQDTRELARAVDQFHDTIHDNPDPLRVRQAYSGIDATWHHLKSMLALPGNATPAVARAAGRVDQADDQIHSALGLNVPADLNRISHRMADEIRIMADDIGTDLGQTPQGEHLLQDARELAQAVDQFHDTIHDNPDPLRVRQAYSGIDSTWHHLKGMLTQPGSATPAVAQDAARIDQLDAQIHQTLDLNVPPANFYGNGPAPAGMDDTRRLALVMDQRAMALLSAVRTTMVEDPGSVALVRQVAGLQSACDQLHDALGQNLPAAQIQPLIDPIARGSAEIGRYIQAGGDQIPPQVLSAWQSFISAEVLIRQNPNPGMTFPGPAPEPAMVLNPAGGGPSPLVGLADQLVGQSNAFLQAFGPAARVVPEGRFMLADGERLEAGAQRFRQEVAQGIDPGRLAFEFRDVFESWNRLGRRMARVAAQNGIRTGPNIQRANEIGETCRQISQLLAMPGFSQGPVPFPPMGDRPGDENR